MGKANKNCHEKKWIDEIVESCKGANIPLYIKDNAHYPKVIKQFPKELLKEGKNENNSSKTK
jgi:hypothetical protein